MAQSSQRAPSLPLDVLALILDLLEDDKPSQCNVALTCRAWQPLAQAALLRHVDISSHNLGRRTELEQPGREVYADFDADFRQRNLLPRQRAFLRMMMARPDLAKQVKALTWTLIWRDFGERMITNIDRFTWDVFEKMTKVVTLDLASLHLVHDDAYVRANPDRLFPAVTDLRLSGWMHRSLVKSIVTSIDASKLRSLTLDYLQDEGALPDGAPMSMEFADEYAHHAHASETPEEIGEALIERQQDGQALIFPGPMWFPLHILSGQSLGTLAHLQIKLACFHRFLDKRNYYTLFRETARLLAKARQSIRYVLLVCGEAPELHESTCGTTRGRHRLIYLPWCVKMAACFMQTQLSVLDEHHFPQLRRFRFEGFRDLTSLEPMNITSTELRLAYQALQQCRIEGVSSKAESNVDHHPVFYGQDCATEPAGDLDGLLAQS